MRVLLVEDFEDTRNYLKKVLQDRGHEVDAHSSTETAWPAYDQVQADFAIIDSKLPGGIELCSRIRKHAKGERVYILVCTASTIESNVAEILNSGAHDYVSMPITNELLTLRITVAESHAENLVQRRQLERALAALQSNIFHSDDAIIGCLFNGEILTWNPSATRIMGFMPQEAIGKQLGSFNPRTGDSDFQMIKTGIERGERIHDLEISYRSKTGGDIFVSVNALPLKDDGGINIGLTITARDISSTLEANKELRATEIKVRSLFESDLIGMLFWKLDGTITDANRHFLKAIGYSKEDIANGTLDWKAISSGEYARAEQRAVEQIRVRGECDPYEMQFIHKNGDSVPVLIGGVLFEKSLDSGVSFVLNLSARKQLETQLSQSQKLEAIGMLAGGIAHDFNNLLTVMMGRAALVQQRIGPDSASSKDLSLICSTGERASSLTRQLLQYSRQQSLRPKVLRMNSVVSSMHEMLSRLIGENYDFKTILSDHLPNIRCDKSQLEQVILNLAVNGRDAMPAGGRLTIETAEHTFDEAFLRSHPQAHQGSYVMLAVTDTGTGMDPVTMKRIFEPFFTTKAAGKGTGLGLATVYGIVKQSGGEIVVNSELNKFTTFKVYLPAVEAPVAASSNIALTAIGSKSATILLVEDDIEVGNLVREMVAEAGFTVLVARDGVEALSMAREFSHPIDLLISDIMMPIMGGPKVAAELRVRRPEIKILFMSGYTKDTALQECLLDEAYDFIDKPFSANGFLSKVREVLCR